jgi:hypothetical protein
MYLTSLVAASAVFSSRTVSAAVINSSCAPPTVTTLNGTYSGYHNSFYNEDYFLGIPFAQPPVNELRYAAPQSINGSWTGVKNTTEYGPECVGYGVSSALVVHFMESGILMKISSWIQEAKEITSRKIA